MQNSRESDESRRLPWSPADQGAAAQGAATQATADSAQSDREPPDLTAELARVEDRYKRALADLDNYRKRSARELERRVSEATEATLRDWLEALDSVELALALDTDERCRAGMQAVLDQMDAILRRRGVERLGSPGEPFDPERHEAIGVEVTDAAPSRTIKSVERSGFALGDRVIRPAQVVVTRAPEPAG
jgi:molecular chaperone GrpE